MKTKIIVEYIVDHMPDISECEEICTQENVNKKGNSALSYVATGIIKDEGLAGLVSDEFRILEISPIKAASTF
jgi:hypothetical protein